jgi:hypothetical protein
MTLLVATGLSPWHTVFLDVGTTSISQTISRSEWNLQVYHHIKKSPPPVPKPKPDSFSQHPISLRLISILFYPRLSFVGPVAQSV